MAYIGLSKKLYKHPMIMYRAAANSRIASVRDLCPQQRASRDHPQSRNCSSFGKSVLGHRERRDFCHLVKAAGTTVRRTGVYARVKRSPAEQVLGHTETQLKSRRRSTCCRLLTPAVGPSSLCSNSALRQRCGAHPR